MIPGHEELALTQGGLEAGAMEPAASTPDRRLLSYLESWCG